MKYLIIEEPKKQVYIDFIEYAYNKSDVVSFKVITRIAHQKRLKREFNKLCALLNKSKEEIIKLYNDPDFINEAFLNLKHRKGIVGKWTNPLKGIERKINKNKEEIHKIKEQHIKMDIQNIIFMNAGKFIFDKKMEQIRDFLKEDFIRKESIIENSRVMNDYDIYYYKVSNRIKELLIEQKTLYNMMFPNFPEDIRFFKNNSCLIETVTHEKLAFIDIENLQEYNDLRVIGLKLKEC